MSGSSERTLGRTIRTGAASGRRRQAAHDPAPVKPAAKRPPSAIAAKPSTRAARAAERRSAIVAAGLAEFSARGFAATRLDDVAKRAGVAKGTIYLHFTDKEALFQELIRTALVPLVVRLNALPQPGVSVRTMLETFAETFVREVVQTNRADILRLIMAEGARFPSLAEFHYREVVQRGLAGMRKLIELGVARGEIRHAALAEFPQLVVAPALLAVVWQGLFGKHAPLDALAMLRVHIDLLFGERSTP
jgi:AcrR family transcriptional regulator